MLTAVLAWERDEGGVNSTKRPTNLRVVTNTSWYNITGAGILTTQLGKTMAIARPTFFLDEKDAAVYI